MLERVAVPWWDMSIKMKGDNDANRVFGWVSPPRCVGVWEMLARCGLVEGLASSAASPPSSEYRALRSQVLEMWGYNIAARNLGIRHTVMKNLQVEPQG